MMGPLKKALHDVTHLLPDIPQPPTPLQQEASRATHAHFHGKDTHK